MTDQKPSLENEFGKLFYSPLYIRMKNCFFNYRYRKQEITKIFNQLKPPHNFFIADIGSGISPITPDISKTLFVELEPQAVELLQKQGIRAIQGDVTQLPMESESIDMIICSEVLEHVREYRKGLTEIARVLKKDGVAIISVPLHAYYWKDDDEFVGHHRRFESSGMQNDMTAAGLTVVLKKPIGSWLERYLTWLTVKVARKNTASSNFKISRLTFALFSITNSILLQFVKISAVFTSEKGASMMIFVAQRQPLST